MLDSADSLDYYILLDSLKLDIIDYPLDRRLTLAQKETLAADDSDGGIWQYTTVPPDFNFPTETVHEVIDEVYMPRTTAIIGYPVGNFQTTSTQDQFISTGCACISHFW